MKLPRRQGSSSESSQGFATSHIVATTPARSRAAQRNSPRVTGLARSADGIFFSQRRKGTMSDKPVAIKLGDLLANPKGGKFFPVCAEDGGPAVWQCDWIRILWHPTAYNGEDARRLPLCLEPNQAAATELAGFEKALVAQLAARSQTDPKLFGRMLTTQDTESRFVSCLKTSTRGNSFIKLKVCLDQVRLWDAQGQSLPEMGDLSNRECKVRAELKQVWMMSGQCGLLVEVTDLMLKEEEPQRCPF